MTLPEAVQAAEDLVGWHAAGVAGEVPVDGAIVNPVKPTVAVFRLEDDGFFATDDTRTHALSSLAERYIEDGTVECDFRFAKFDFRSGKALTPPERRGKSGPAGSRACHSARHARPRADGPGEASRGRLPCADHRRPGLRLARCPS
jgi:3-phenylpropionate/trans-cinnamate dioxygenase ferredoxin subunit